MTKPASVKLTTTSLKQPRGGVKVSTAIHAGPGVVTEKLGGDW